MRCAEVKLSVVRRQARRSFSPADYLGNIEQAEDELRLASQHLRSAKRRYARAEQALADAMDKRLANIASGDVVPIEETKWNT